MPDRQRYDTTNPAAAERWGYCTCSGWILASAWPMTQDGRSVCPLCGEVPEMLEEWSGDGYTITIQVPAAMIFGPGFE